MSGGCRTPSGGRIDRSVELPFVVDGRRFVGHPGDTLASALLASGVIEVGASIYRQRPRGIVAAGVEEPNALVNLRRPGQSVVEPMVPTTTVELVAGLAATTLSGVGDLDPADDTSLYDKVFVHTDVLVVGAGPAGLTAAREAAATGVRVIVVDDQPELGGSLLSDPAATGDDALAAIEAELRAAPEVTVLTRTTALGDYDANFVVALENRLDHLGAAAADAATAGVSRQRLWHIRAGEVVLATGAHERPLVFADNDRPGVMLASAVRTYLNRYGVLAGRRIVVATTNDSAYAMVPELVAAGAEVVLVADARDVLSPVARAARDAGTEVRTSTAPAGTEGEHRVRRVAVAPIDDQGLVTGDLLWVDADLLAVSGGWSPVVHLHSQRQGRLRWDDDVVAFVPDGNIEAHRIVGAASGDLELGPVRALWLVREPAAEPADLDTHFVDLQRDQTVRDILRATGAGLRGVEHVKRYTSISTASDQGKTSAVNAIGVIADALGGAAAGQAAPGQVGTTTYRAPYTPVAFAALAGRSRGDLFDPTRLTSIHRWHVERGAEFELVGQWLRPRYYPRPGESMAEAVRRECAAVRTGVGMMDATTLGKIEIRGADAGELLNRVYTNAFKKLAPGAARYGLMCTPDGMIFDDGVTLRLDEQRYFMTTTTGGAARVLDWLEEWHQTEWPDLDVAMTSVTEQWTTIAVAGPRSRAVIARLAPDLDVDNAAFPFLTFRETVLGCGVPARICRISFSGELAFEVNVSGWYGQAIWEEILEAGQELGITPYGTETMHVLRAEKGYPIVGQDTDGSVTPHDAGMGWAVSKVKDFIGKRSFTRTDTARTDRKHLVSVLPIDRTTLLPEGCQLIGRTMTSLAVAAPVPMLGHVTSSYHSVALDRTFALALVKNGRNLVGTTLTAVVGDRLVDVVVGDTVLYDPEGSRRDG